MRYKQFVPEVKVLVNQDWIKKKKKKAKKVPGPRLLTTVLCCFSTLPLHQHSTFTSLFVVLSLSYYGSVLFQD